MKGRNNESYIYSIFQEKGIDPVYNRKLITYAGSGMMNAINAEPDKI